MKRRPVTQTASPDNAVPTGQRRRATVLFADMEGFTPLAERLGEEAVYHVMQRVVRLMAQSVGDHGGTVQEVMGDGILALFGAPVAIEDAPLRACQAAIAMHQRMAALASEIEAEHGASPRLRVGLHAGAMVVGEIGDGSGEVTAIGDAINVASRLQGAAEPGTTLMSDALHAIASNFVEATALGEKSLKGKKIPLQVYRLDGLRSNVTRFEASRRRGLTRLVGRERELETLAAAWRTARDGGVAAIAVSGEAGVGKSRLVYEFHQMLDGQGAYMLEGHCAGDRRGQPFLPFIEITRRSFRIDASTDTDRVRDKIGRGLDALGIEADATAPYLLNLLGHAPDDPEFQALDNEVVGSRTRNALLALLRARCRISATAMFLEDLHWVDSATQGLLERIVADRELSRLLFVGTYRPDYAGKWIARPSTARIALNRLSPAMVGDLIRSRLSVETVPTALSVLVQKKAEGNPLFAEEILNYLVETGQVVVTEDAAVFRDEAVLAVPITVENMLMDRVDRLPGEARAMLEAAAVLGRSFETGLVTQVAGVSEAERSHLETLVEHDVILPRSAGAYAFKHALLRDAIYDSLLMPRRRELHARAAAAIEQAGADAEVVEALAYHWSQANRPEKAVPALARAGEESLRVYSLTEAEARFRDALAYMDNSDALADEILYVDMLLHLARILYFRSEMSRVIELVDNHLPRVEALGDEKRLARFLFEGGYARVFHGEAETGKQWLERSLAIAERIGSDEARAYAALGIAWYYAYWAPPDPENWQRLRDLGEVAFETGRRIRDTWLASKALYALCQCGALVYGRPGEAERWGRRLLAYSQETNDPRPRCMGLFGLAFVALSSGQGDVAVDYSDEAIQIALSPLDRMIAEFCKGYGLALLGRTQESAEAISDCRVFLDEFLSAGQAERVFEGMRLVIDGEIGKGVALIRAERQAIDSCGNLAGMISARQLTGDIYLTVARSKERPSFRVIMNNLFFLVTNAPRAAKLARRAFEELLDLAARIDAPAYRSYAMFKLGQLAEMRGSRDEAQALFEEARTVAQEVEAKAILTEIDAALAGIAQAAE